MSVESMLVRCVCFALASLLGVASAHGGQASSTAAPTIVANDNRRAAGASANGSLTLRLVAEQGTWQPEGPNARTLSVQAFREEAGTLSTWSVAARAQERTSAWRFGTRSSA
jgi:hypothetical protein